MLCVCFSVQEHGIIATVMIILLTRHAKEKFHVLRRHGFVVSEHQVLDTVERPDVIDHSRLPLIIAQCSIDPDHVLRVVYKKISETTVKIITFYPGRKKDYGQR